MRTLHDILASELSHPLPIVEPDWDAVDDDCLVDFYDNEEIEEAA